MLVMQIIILAFLLVGIPLAVGTLFVIGDKSVAKLPFAWISGQMMLWAGFQLICVPLVLWEKSFELVIQCFWIYTGVLLVMAAVGIILRLTRGQKLHPVKKREGRGKLYSILWIVFFLLLAMQLILTAVLAYEEGDDAFYVAISTITEESNTMYRILPYTGGSTGLDARHGLAPFPVWIAFLARVSGMPAVTVAQVVLPMVFIVMSYGIYYAIARGLLAKKQKFVPLFMLFVTVLILFGGYSVYSAENFLLVRTSQGKAVLANIVIPFLMLLSWRILDEINKGEKIGVRRWLLLGLTMIAGCLCSTLGAVLTCMLLGVVGVCTAVCYRKWSVLFPMLASCIIPVMFAALYLLLE